MQRRSNAGFRIQTNGVCSWWCFPKTSFRKNNLVKPNVDRRDFIQELVICRLGFAFAFINGLGSHDSGMSFQ